MKNVIIRVGEGQSPSGKILDHYTRWYNLKSYKEAIKDADDRNRKIYISINNQKYREIKPEQLIKYGNE